MRDSWPSITHEAFFVSYDGAVLYLSSPEFWS